MSRARSHSDPNMTGKLSRSDTRTRSLVSATLQAGMANSANTALSATVMPAQPSTSVLSQSYSSAVGTDRGFALDVLADEAPGFEAFARCKFDNWPSPHRLAGIVAKCLQEIPP